MLAKVSARELIYDATMPPGPDDVLLDVLRFFRVHWAVVMGVGLALVAVSWYQFGRGSVRTVKSALTFTRPYGEAGARAIAGIPAVVLAALASIALLTTAFWAVRSVEGWDAPLIRYGFAFSVAWVILFWLAVLARSGALVTIVCLLGGIAYIPAFLFGALGFVLGVVGLLLTLLPNGGPATVEEAWLFTWVGALHLGVHLSWWAHVMLEESLTEG